MKLSNETLSLLKNFATINQGILFKQGKTIKTVSSHKNILAEATITEDVPTEFGVYDLNNFLSVVSLYKDDPSFEFIQNDVVICGNKGRSKTKYRFCDPKSIVIPPEKALTMPSPEIAFELTQEDLDWALRSASVLSSPQIAVESDGTKVTLVALNLQDNSAHTQTLDIAIGNGDKYRMVFKTENLKMIAGTYDVKISSKGISHFKNKNKELQYWITTEAGSTFTKA
jgi:hypothetical protein